MAQIFKRTVFDGLLPVCTLCLVFFMLVPNLNNPRAFTFEEYERNEAAAVRSRDSEIANLESVQCSSSLKNKTIALVVAQRNSFDYYSFNYMNYGDLASVFNQKLRKLGLKTYSPARIKARIAQAEMQAFLNNDQDAAVSAASRLGASFFIKGIISTRLHRNAVVRLDEIFITMDFTLTDSSGTEISSVTISDSAFSNAEVLGTLRKMVREQAGYVVAKLYHDYCVKH